MTILGSCVAVGLWDELASVGGMIHFALPQAPKNGSREPYRYGDSGIAATLDRLHKLGARREGVRAKVFGGAGVLQAADQHRGRLGVQNVEIALRGLLEQHIPIVSVETGGRQGRKVLFHTHDGSAWIKQVHS